jgi:hypothetical protein
MHFESVLGKAQNRTDLEGGMEEEHIRTTWMTEHEGLLPQVRRI